VPEIFKEINPFPIIDQVMPFKARGSGNYASLCSVLLYTEISDHEMDGGPTLSTKAYLVVKAGRR